MAVKGNICPKADCRTAQAQFAGLYVKSVTMGDNHLVPLKGKYIHAWSLVQYIAVALYTGKGMVGEINFCLFDIIKAVTKKYNISILCASINVALKYIKQKYIELQREITYSSSWWKVLNICFNNW